MCANVISTCKKDLKIICTSFLNAWPKYLFLSVLYIKGSLVIVFLSFCREEPGSTSLLYRKNSRLSCILSSLGRRFSGRTTQLLSPPHPIPSSSSYSSFLLFPSPFSSPLSSCLSCSIFLPIFYLQPPPFFSTLPHLQSFPQITLPPWCIPVLRRAH